jgi:hypothetical protein
MQVEPLNPVVLRLKKDAPRTLQFDKVDAWAAPDFGWDTGTKETVYPEASLTFQRDDFADGIYGSIGSLTLEGADPGSIVNIKGCTFTGDLHLNGNVRLRAEKCEFLESYRINVTCGLMDYAPGIWFAGIEGEFAPASIHYYFGQYQGQSSGLVAWNEELRWESFIDEGNSVKMRPLRDAIVLHNDKQRTFGVEYSKYYYFHHSLSSWERYFLEPYSRYQDTEFVMIQVVAELEKIEGKNAVVLRGTRHMRKNDDDSWYMFVGGMAFVGLVGYSCFCALGYCCQVRWMNRAVREKEEEMAKEAARRLNNEYDTQYRYQ